MRALTFSFAAAAAFSCASEDDPTCSAGFREVGGSCVPISSGGDPAGGGDPTTGDPMTGDPVMGDPMTGDPAMGDPMTGDPMMGDPMTGDPAMGDPMTGDPMMGDPMTGDPMMGDPGGPLPDCTVDMDSTAQCMAKFAACGAAVTGGQGCAVEGLGSCYNSGAFSYKITDETAVIDFSGDVNSLSVFFVHQGAGSGTMTFFDDADSQVDTPLTTDTNCLAVMDSVASVTFSAPVRSLSIAATGTVWLDDLRVNP